MKVWEVQDAWGIDNMQLVNKEVPETLASDEILIKLHAASINYRDLVTIENRTPFGALPQIPLSDAAGEVVKTGSAVDRFSVGDRVCPSFFPNWQSGPVRKADRSVSLGSASAPGVLQEFFVTKQQAASRFSDTLSYQEAATLPCAGLTAWRALVVEGQVEKDEWVLVQGTGGVSIFALLIAKMRGAKVIVTSSSDEKLTRARDLGADETINYRETPDWGAKALEITGGQGVDVIVEVGGGGTINQSLVAAAVGARIVIIGVLGGRSQELLMPAVFGKNLRLFGISVGNREQFESFNLAITEGGLRPVIDKVFPFESAPDAIRHLASGEHFGKIVIDFGA